MLLIKDLAKLYILVYIYSKMASRQNLEDYGDEDERSHYDYNNGIPPYAGARWDQDINAWVSGPDDNQEDNDRILPEDIVLEPASVLAAASAPTPIQSHESRRDRMRRLMRERAPARAPAPVVAVPPPPPTPPVEDPRIVEARIGLPSLPSPWKAIWSNTYNAVYYFDPRNGQTQWEQPTMGGKRTRRRSRSRAKRPKRKRSTRRRKRTTTRRK